MCPQYSSPAPCSCRENKYRKKISSQMGMLYLMMGHHHAMRCDAMG